MNAEGIKQHCKQFGHPELSETAEKILKDHSISNMHADHSLASHIAGLYIHIGIINECIKSVNNRLTALEKVRNE